MRLLAFTDVHGDPGALRRLREKAQQADLIVTAGDFTVFEHDAARILAALAMFPKPVLLIPGNHEYSGRIEEACARIPNLHCVDRRAYRHGDLTFLGWGGGGFAPADSELEAAMPRIAKDLAGAPFVLLLHGPPHGTALDRLAHLGHRGCRTRRALIERTQPRLVLCGHLHENFGKTDCLGKSLLLNPGPDGTLLEIKPLLTVESIRR